MYYVLILVQHYYRTYDVKFWQPLSYPLQVFYISRCISLNAANVLYMVTFLVKSQVWWLFFNFFNGFYVIFFVGGPNKICIFYMRTDKCFI